MIEIIKSWASSFYLYSTYDIFELLFFVSFFASIGYWIKKDKSPFLLSIFFGYSFGLSLATYLQLQSILTFFYFYAPSAFLILLMMHQDRLQKGLITLKKLPAPQTNVHDWIDTLIFSALHARSISKSFICCIEQLDTLDPLINCSLKLDLPFDKQVAQLIIESRAFHDSSFIWINQQGIIRGINCSPTHSKTELITFAQKTDALIIECSPANAGFNVHIHNTYYEQITAKQLSSFLKQQCIINSKHQSQGAHYVQTSPTDREQSYS